ncbi:toll/interleukin-1 receptor domain-containing protein [Pseudofrankia inefficax]|uniref:WD40 repeat, subgroup n=1 Tax=Pseudofrankia inefficax (strain DSM 45817 / CECT 9037 / DDB 130130 / EuI1c) TaxID=298654 RepID=E3IW96_PSEI1|nr:TIR domain-containing protein [Pseudofrankia inefficax]ADP78938.1 WD40 repeat, subgroup [Pseudofrankia inefficax]
MTLTGGPVDPEGWDFFVSYTGKDRAWAEWLAWQLEDAGHSVLIQAWDFVAGSDWAARMDQGIRLARRTIAVLSDAYLGSVYGAQEWRSAQVADPGGFARKLLPIRIEDCPRPGLLRTIVSIDLFGLTPEDARRRLLEHVRGAIDGRIKPPVAPSFPTPPREAPPARRPDFPTTQSPAVTRALNATWSSSKGRRATRRPAPADPAGPRPLGDPLTGHTAGVQSLAFSPDGQLLATASADTTVRLWNVTDPADPEPLGQPLDGNARLLSVAFSPDGQTLATTSDDTTVQLWDLTDPADPGPLGQPLTGHSDWVWSVAFSPDGQILATASDDKTVRLWDVAGRRRLGKPLTSDKAPMLAVAFSPDGKTLATGDDNKTQLWDLSDPARPQRLGTLLVTEPTRRRRLGARLTEEKAWVSSVAFSPDGRALATAGGDRAVWLWDVTDPARPQALGQPLTGHTDDVRSVAFAPDGRTLASASIDNTLRLWDVTDPARSQALGEPLTGHTDGVQSVAFAPDGRILASASTDSTVRLWRL